jgi:hypothetical protein
MSTAKFEKLIDLIINEDNERAEQLFHEIVVEKSRDIYESLINEDMTSGFVDEVTSEEEGMDGMMEDDEFIDDEEIDGDYDTDGEDGDVDFDDEVELDGDEDGEGYEEEELEDRVVDLEDKLDQLMAEFEQEFGGGEEEGEEEFGSQMGDEEEGEEEEESGVMEAVEMKKVSVTHTDGADGSSKKSTVDANSGQKGMASKPVNFSGSSESVPTSPKKPTNYGAKGETEVKGAGSFKNKVGGDASNGSGKGESAPKPTKTQASGTNERSAVPESRRTTKRRI